MRMKNVMLSGLVLPCLLTGCLWAPGPHGGGEMVMVPILPPIVVLGPEPYYEHNGYHYYYRDGGWAYSHSRGGPWVTLPKDHYPREVRYNNGGSGHDKGRNLGHQER